MFVNAVKPEIRWDVLGPVELRSSGEVVDLGGVRSRALFAALVLKEGRAASRAELIDLIWGERPPDTAANQLQIAVHRVRTALTSAGLDAHRVLRREGTGYVLDPPPEVGCRAQSANTGPPSPARGMTNAYFRLCSLLPQRRPAEGAACPPTPP